jgi:hypothetical protein
LIAESVDQLVLPHGSIPTYDPRVIGPRTLRPPR